MKFAIVTLFTLALALGVQSSILPWGGVVTQVAGGPLSYTAVSSPVVSGWPWGGAVVSGIPAAVPAVVAGHASYVAQTRGAVHSAPLAGHLNSVANVNVAPAPGTI
ncbi:adult cuticle protein 1-like [Lucilia sericata]|uniref:adult cuticle protein 1-like n=1 Tax=Lucilia sericata TaxID=13632 RepID=UPI000C71C213|nr:adult cuticle protein 1-like [Lucilia sericata]KAI8124954.1 Adult cuticle protein 1 [Lucilia cuprina]